MSSTFMRGLRLLEIVALEGPIGVSDLARRLGTDKAGVSRMVTAAEKDGWLTRTPEGVQLGPRLPVLGYDTHISASMRDLRPLMEAIAGVTGLLVQACCLIGDQMVPVLSSGRLSVQLPTPLALPLPIWGTASGRALSTVLDDSELDRILPTEPFPDPMSMIDARPSFLDTLPAGSDELEGWRDTGRPVTTRAEFTRLVAEVRASGVSRERGEVHPLLGCIAVPWAGAPLPASVSVIGPVRDVVASAPLIAAVLTTAVTPGADLAKVVGAAASLLTA